MKIKWKPEFILQAYLLAEQGNNQRDISTAFEIDHSTFVSWKKKYPALRIAYRKGIAARKNGNGKEQLSFFDYVYGQLPEELKPTWDAIMVVEKPKYIRGTKEKKKEQNENGIMFLERLLEKQGKRGRQYLFVHAFTNSCFNLSEALRMTRISYHTYLNWRETDPDFANILEQLKFHMENFLEGSLFKLVAMLDPGSVRFACERLLRHKYGAELKVTGNNLTQPTNVINIAELNLTLEAKKELLGKIREVKQVDSVEVKPKQIEGKNKEDET